MHAGFDHVRRQDGGIGFVGGYRGHDVGAAHRFSGGGTAHDGQRARLGVGAQVRHQLVGSAGVHIEHAKHGDAQLRHERNCLEFALRAIADQRHGFAIPAGQHFGRHGRGRSRAQGGGNGELAEQLGVTGGHIGQHAKGHHGGQALQRVLGVAVHVLERVQRVVGHRHQLDDTVGAVVGSAGGFVEVLPTQKVFTDGLGHLGHHGGQTVLAHQGLHVMDVDIAGHGLLLRAKCREGMRIPHLPQRRQLHLV